jgi:hypothetical protein
MRSLAVLLPASLVVAAALTGCGFDPSAVDTSSHGSLALQGIVHGGQQPVYHATIQLYTVGSSGNGSAATPMISGLVQTAADGSFNIGYGAGAYDYSCVHSTDQVYLTATQGNPGLASGTNNAALVMMAALGNCGNLSAATYISINELTTVAAAYALAPFAAGYAGIGSSSTNSAGIANAMLDAQLITSSYTGAPPTLPSNLSVTTGILTALADVIATCINSDGTAACQPLFAAATPTNGATPTDTFGAALAIVKNPGQNPAGIFNLIPSQPPYPTTLSETPYDWTMALTVTGGGINSPTALDIDANGNIWVGNYYGVLAEFSPQGTPLSGSGFGIGVLNEVYGLTIDTNGNIWVANEQSNPNGGGSVSKFLGSNSATPGTVVFNGPYSNFWDPSIDFPVALSADTNGDIFIANYANSSSTAYSTSGATIGAGLGSSYAAFPVAVAADNSHGVWIANLGDDTVTHVDQNGNLLANPNCCDGANGIAVDAYGNAWVANYYGNSFSEVSSAGVTLINNAPVVGPAYSSYPAGISIDAAQNIWIANYRGESFSEIAGANAITPTTTGTMLSPVYGYGFSGLRPASPLILLPYGIVPDRSGNIWISNFGNNNLVMFFGIASPTATPVQPTPAAP